MAHELCETFTFFIFPMVNPDGVIHGNSRTNLMGYDINRSWNLGIMTETGEALQIWAYILKIIE
jgi:murein tripeptide amidase MpaA